MAQAWEYEFLEVQLGNLRSKWVLINEGIRYEGTIGDLLNAKGAEGWEIISSMHPTPSHWEFVMKRPASGPPLAQTGTDNSAV